MLYVWEWLLEHIFVPRTDHERARYNCLKQIALFYHELEAWNAVASPAKVAALGRTHVIMYTQLSSEHRHLVDRLAYHPWKFYPKHHLFVHLVEVGVRRCGNSREVWRYADESAIGEAVTVTESCHPCYTIRNVIDKRRL